MEENALIAKDIDEVIEHLEQIIHQSKIENSRLGYFASLYHKVTVKMKEGIDEGQFQNGQLVAELDVFFANYYLRAIDQWKKGNTVSQSWQIAFKATEQSSGLILQHLLLGINAHINFDLGIAAVETAKNRNIDISELRKDFNAINTILAALSYSMFNKLNIVSPLLSFLGFTGTKSNSMLVQFSLGNARDGAWRFAEDLAGLTAAQHSELTSKRDNDIAELGKSLLKSRGVLKFGVWFIYLFEWKNVRRVISVLHEHKKLYRHQLKGNG